jgi:hypothetical protein
MDYGKLIRNDESRSLLEQLVLTSNGQPLHEWYEWTNEWYEWTNEWANEWSFLKPISKSHA